MKRVIIEFLIGLPVVVILYFLLDFLYCTFITKTPFVFDFRSCGIAICVWIVVELVTYFARKGKSQ